MLELKKASGPDSIFVSVRRSTTTSRRTAAQVVSLWGSNNCDHQARICHSPRSPGREYLGLRRDDEFVQRHANSKPRCTSARTPRSTPGLDAAHAAREGNRHQDDRRRSALHANRGEGDQYIRIRSGSDIPFLFGMLHHIFKNGWEDKEVHRRRVYGWTRFGRGTREMTPDKVLDACGVDEAPANRLPRRWPRTVPALGLVHGQTQHSIGNAMVRASCIVHRARQHRRQRRRSQNLPRHDNVQVRPISARTRIRCRAITASPKARGRFAKVWDVDFEWIRSSTPGMMGKPG